MDSDCDGLISSDSIELRPLSTEVIESISPLLLEMESLNIQINAEDFVQAAYKIIEVTRDNW